MPAQHLSNHEPGAVAPPRERGALMLSDVLTASPAPQQGTDSTTQPVERARARAVEQRSRDAGWQPDTAWLAGWLLVQRLVLGPGSARISLCEDVTKQSAAP